MKPLQILCAIVLTLCLSVSARGTILPSGSPYVTVSLSKFPNVDKEKPNKPDNPRDPNDPTIPDNGHRSPGLQYLCVIDPVNGISISGCEQPDIASYSIYNEEDELLLETPDETLFIETLFSLFGMYRISLEADDWIYSGWLEI